MVLSLPARVKVYLAKEVTDMRKSFDGLCAVVEHRFRRDPYGGDVFVFINRRRTYVKLLLWDGNGFWLLAKRLERGTFERWQPSSGEETHVEINRAQLLMLLEGVDLKKAEFRRHYDRFVGVGRRSGSSEEDTGRR